MDLLCRSQNAFRNSVCAFNDLKDLRGLVLPLNLQNSEGIWTDLETISWARMKLDRLCD